MKISFNTDEFRRNPGLWVNEQPLGEIDHASCNRETGTITIHCYNADFEMPCEGVIREMREDLSSSQQALIKLKVLALQLPAACQEAHDILELIEDVLGEDEDPA
jgi:hypothetical protein